MGKKVSDHDDKIMQCSTFDELLDAEYGKPGTPEREQFNADSTTFCIAETLKEEHNESVATRQNLILNK